MKAAVDRSRTGLHLCALYSGPEERDRLLVPFVQEGRRTAAETSWVLHEPDTTGFLDYESAVDETLAELPGHFLCLYDLGRCQGAMLGDILRIHSEVLLDGAVLHNPHSQPPTGYPPVAPGTDSRYRLTRVRSDSEDSQNPWLALTGAEVRVAELVASGMTNRAIAEELIVSPHTVDAHLKHMYLKLGIHSRVALTVLALRHGFLRRRTERPGR
jgi:DNA-binding CsgD family transcriptional regulator